MSDTNDGKKEFSGHDDERVIPLDSDLLSSEQPADEQVATPTESEFQSTGNFLLLCFLSLGIYPFFWFYKHFVFLRDQKKYDISPNVRVTFLMFYGYWLFHTYKKLAREKGFERNPPLGVFFTLYLLLVVSTAFQIPVLTFVAFFSFLLLVPALNVMNFYYLKEQPALTRRNGLAKDEKFFLIVVWCIFIFVIINT